MYKYIERMLKGNTKAVFLHQTTLVGSCAIANFTTVMATKTVHIFTTYAYCDQRQYLEKYLRKLHKVKV